mmetsp:Transcript_18392/g.37204  ORF Transcript_18392/g.37204 Transcript_18392/m.37204 type:complete len:216 (+) Transcript_18392:550-1197(+)
MMVTLQSRGRLAAWQRLLCPLRSMLMKSATDVVVVCLLLAFEIIAHDTIVCELCVAKQLAIRRHVNSVVVRHAPCVARSRQMARVSRFDAAASGVLLVITAVSFLAEPVVIAILVHLGLDGVKTVLPHASHTAEVRAAMLVDSARHKSLVAGQHATHLLAVRILRAGSVLRPRSRAACLTLEVGSVVVLPRGLSVSVSVSVSARMEVSTRVRLRS